MSGCRDERGHADAGVHGWSAFPHRFRVDNDLFHQLLGGMRGFHQSTIGDSWSLALAGRPRRRAWIVLASSSTIGAPLVLLFGSGTVAQVVAVAWRCASELSTVVAFRLVLVASGRPCDLDGGHEPAGRLEPALGLKADILGFCEGILGVPERQLLSHQFSLDRV